MKLQYVAIRPRNNKVITINSQLQFMVAIGAESVHI